LDYSATFGRAAFEVDGWARLGLNTGAGFLGNATAGFTGEIFNNLATHTALWSGVGFATLAGGLLGAVGGSIGEAVAFNRSINWNDEFEALAANGELTTPGSQWSSSTRARVDELLARPEGARWIPQTKFTNFMLTLLGFAFSAIDGAVNAIWDAAGWSQRF
jgi:hypothetical protein